MSPDDYKTYCTVLKTNSGLILGDEKQYLLESRLPTVATKYGFSGLGPLAAALRGAPDRALLKAVCDAMTTGETFFFRDGAPFDAFKDKLLPQALAAARATRRPVRIWCGACSTGQEVYSLAMILAEQEAELAGTSVEILATDYSTPTLNRAKEGCYNQFEVQRGLPVTRLVRWFSPTPTGFQIKEELKKRVTFKEFNLLHPFTSLGMFDIVFLRNVLIYFDPATKKDILERVGRQLNGAGCIVLGGTETTIGITDKLMRMPETVASVYVRSDGTNRPLSGVRAVA